MKKMTHVSAYRALSSLSNKQIVYINSRRTPFSLPPHHVESLICIKLCKKLSKVTAKR